MTTTRLALLLGAALGLAPAAASAQHPVPAGVVREGTLSFDGRASVGAFTGTTSTVRGEMTGGGLTEVRGWVEAPVQSLTTGNTRRDRDLNRSMESEKFPTIRFELTGVGAESGGGDSLPVVLHGRFIIHGVTREATVAASVVFLPDGIRVRGQTPLNLKDYDIGGLTRMMGMLKMYEEIVVHVDLVFGVSASPPAQAQATDPA